MNVIFKKIVRQRDLLFLKIAKPFFVFQIILYAKNKHLNDKLGEKGFFAFPFIVAKTLVTL